MASGGQQPETGLNIIVSTVSSKNHNETVKAFAETFQLESEPAGQILNSAPIVLLSGVSQESLEAMQEKLISLSKSGIEFTIAKHIPPTLPRVTWPGKSPDFTLSPAGELIQYVDFQWRGNAFVCPNCAETFVFKRIGNPLKRYMQVKDKAAGGVASTIPVVNLPAFTQKPAAHPASGTPVHPDTAGGKKEPAPHPAAQPLAHGHDTKTAAHKDVVVELPHLPEKEIEVSFPGDESDDNIVELKPLDFNTTEKNPELEPVNLGSEADNVSAQSAARADQETAPVIDIGLSKIDEVENGDVIIQQVGENGTPVPPGRPKRPAADINYNLFLTSIPDDKKLMATELIARIKGISLNQAHELTDRLLVPVLKDVTEESANKCLKEFQNLGIQGRVIIRK